MRIICASLLFCFAVVIFCGCSSMSPSNQQFNEMDVDEDGYVTWPEYKKVFPDTRRKVFLATDEDSDERLNINEFRAGVGISF